MSDEELTLANLEEAVDKMIEADGDPKEDRVIRQANGRPQIYAVYLPNGGFMFAALREPGYKAL